MKKLDRKKYRSIFVSDVHLGTRHCQAEKLLDFLKSTEAERYYLVGDIIDGWMMRKKIYWPQSHNNILQYFLKLSKKHHQVVFVTGNHDEFLREYSGTVMGNIQLVDEAIHFGVDDQRYIVLHGDQFDMVVANAKWLAHIGGWAYDVLIDLNTRLRWLFRTLKLEGFSLSAWAKHNVKEAINFIGNYEDIVADYAHKKQAAGIICGHIHYANIKDINGVQYLNCGDWVESCTAIVEHYDGTFEIVRML